MILINQTSISYLVGSNQLSVFGARMGDTIVVDKANLPKPGDLLHVMYNDLPLIGWYLGDTLYLPEGPIPLSDVQVIGVAVIQKQNEQKQEDATRAVA